MAGVPECTVSTWNWCPDFIPPASHRGARYLLPSLGSDQSMSITMMAILTVVSFVAPVPLLAWLDRPRRPRGE